MNGIALLGATSGLFAAGTMCVALRDKPYLTEEEREARRAGRRGAISGAGLGVGVSLYAVHAMGVPGYSAAGLSSGLAGLGGLAGGGMAHGIMATVLLPAVFAVILGYLPYRLAKRYLHHRHLSHGYAPRKPELDQIADGCTAVPAESQS